MAIYNINFYELISGHWLHSVRNMSMATEDAAKRVLDIVMRFASFISNPIMRSRPGQQFFKLPVGEVALVTLDSICTCTLEHFLDNTPE